MERRLYLP
uniref:Uncharacterized protein n=1 Tax=Arundo donax TaxID=35708 RepID=A0A0A9FTH2_ARUDO